MSAAARAGSTLRAEFAGASASAAVGVALAVIAGVMLTVVRVLIDGRTRRLVGQLRATGTPREHVYPVTTVVVVATITVGVDFVTAVAEGVVLAMILFILETHRSSVCSVRTGTTIGPRRDYPPGPAAGDHRGAVRRLDTWQRHMTRARRASRALPADGSCPAGDVDESRGSLKARPRSLTGVGLRS